MGSVLFNAKNSTNVLLIEQFHLILERSRYIFYSSDKRSWYEQRQYSNNRNGVVCDDYDDDDDNNKRWWWCERKEKWIRTTNRQFSVCIFVFRYDCYDLPAMRCAMLSSLWALKRVWLRFILPHDVYRYMF